MGDDVREIVRHLNAPPFEKGLTLISFDSLLPMALLRLLNDVLGEISENKVDLREEAPEDTVSRILALLRVFKYVPSTDDARAFRQGLIAAEREIVHPVLLFCLPRLVELKKRAYLARFLVRLDVPPSVLQNEEVADANTKYVSILEEFATAHKALDALQNSGFSTADVKKDITMMEQERDQLLRRIDRVRKKSETLPQYQEMLAAARALRLEHEREDQLHSQREQQESMMLHAEQKLRRLEQQLAEQQSTQIAGGADGVLARLEEEVQMNRYLALDKLPKMLEERLEKHRELERVCNEPAMSQQDLDNMQRKIQTVTAEIHTLTEQRLRANDTGDTKLTLFRQQASMISHKKEGTADKLRDQEAELDRVQEERRQQHAVSQESGPRMLKADEFQVYVAKLRTKSLHFKAKKSELAALRSEYTILSRTEELLRSKDTLIQESLADAEAASGVAGIRDTQENLEKVSAAKSQLDDLKGKTLDEISDMVRSLNETIATKKSSLAPIIKELRSTRAEVLELETLYTDKKAAYDKLARSLDGAQSKLEQEVQGLREQVTQSEDQYHFLQQQMQLVQIQRDHVREELDLYKLSHQTADRKKPYRDVFTKKIAEQETHGRHLRDKQKIIKENHGENMHQLEMWQDLTKLMEGKHQFHHAAGANVTDSKLRGQEDRLVL